MHPKAYRRIGPIGRPCGAALAALLILGAAARAAEPWSALINPDNSLSFSIRRGEQSVFRLSLGGWGPHWAWVGMQARQKAEGDRLSVRVPFVVNKDKGEAIDVHFEAWQPAARQVAFRYNLNAARDVHLTLLMAGVNFERQGSQGTLTLTHADGKQSKLGLPVRGIRAAPATSQAALAFDKGGTVTMKIDPPCPITFDNGMRVVLASDVFPKGTRRVTLTLTFPEEVAFYARQADLDRFTRTLAGPDWFAFQPSKEVTPGVLDMNSWLERPAGKHGGVRMVKDRFAFEDGTSVKFWGTNLSYTASAPTRRQRTSRPLASPSTASTPCACTSFPTPRIRWALATSTTRPAWTRKDSTGSITSSLG